MRTYLRLIFATIALAGLLHVPVEAASRPKLYGIEPPFPKRQIISTPQDSLLVGASDIWQRFWLTIDETGKATGLTFTRVVSSDWGARLERCIARTKFEPGKINGRKVAMNVPGLVTLSVADGSADVLLPVNHRKEVADYDLLLIAIDSNGVELPALESFPWYFSDITRTDTSRSLPYVLIDVVLDTTGRPTNIGVNNTNTTTFAGQLANATNYAGFRPPVVDGRRIPGTVTLAVTFFPTTQYPTRPWSPELLDSLDLHDRLGLRLLPAKIGDIMRKPLPIARGSLEFRIAVPDEFFRKGAVVQCLIDTLGSAKPILDSLQSPEFYQFSHAVAKQLQFYPAMDFSGRLRPYKGSVHLIAADQSSVRVRCLWLDSE